MVPATTKQMILNPAPHVHEVIRERPYEDLARYASAAPGVLEQRLRELDHEWDVDRVTAITFGLVLLGTGLLTWFAGAGWVVLSGIIALCLLLHGLCGWTPALPLIRSLGYRNPWEIAHERSALRMIRGDFPLESPATISQDREDLSRFENEGGSPAKSSEPDVSPHVHG